jgi:hypothetical protein
MAEELLAATRAHLGEPPRRLRSEKFTHPPAPPWLRPDHPLQRAEGDRAFLLENGVVAPAWVVMANSQLFAAGQGARPAVVIYAPNADVDAETLGDAAAAVFALRTAKPVDPELAALQVELANDLHCFVARPVPVAIAQGACLRLAGVVVHREHLPRPYLGGKLLPVLCHPSSPSVVLLPASMWAPDLRAVWIDLAGEP